MQPELSLVLVLLIVLLLHDCEAWRTRRRRRAPPPCHAHDCKISQWSHWSECSRRCGSAGTQHRTRRKTADETCGGNCLFDFTDQRHCSRDGCQNGGTALYARCSCRTGFTGICCEQVAENRKDKANPSQSKDSKAVGIPVGCSVGGVCLAGLLAFIFRLYYKKKKQDNTPPNQPQDNTPANEQKDNTPPNLIQGRCRDCSERFQSPLLLQCTSLGRVGNVAVACPVAWHTELTMAVTSIKTTGKVVALPDYSHYNYGCNYGDLPPVDG